jgi:hypothetical protein
MIHFLKVISNTIGLILIIVTGMIYLTVQLSAPFSEFSKLGLSIIGILAVLSGLCFSYASHIKHDNPMWGPTYAGEKFLHSTILTVQVIVLCFSFEYISKSQWLTNHVVVKCILHTIINVSRCIISVGAFFCISWGFDAINDHLWNRWKERRNKIIKNKDY